MPFEIIRADITDLPWSVHAIVNTAHPNPTHGLGLDAAIFKKAGPQLEARRKEFIGKISEGDAVGSPSFGLKGKAEMILIHTVAPVWRGGEYEEESILMQCYNKSIQLAGRHGCKSIAVPLIGTGNLGFPKEKALKIALNAIMDFCFQNPDVQIYLVLFDRESVDTAKRLQKKIDEYINDDGVSLVVSEEYLRHDGKVIPITETHLAIQESREGVSIKRDRIDDILFRQNPDIGFSEALQMLIATLGEKPSTIYNRAEVDKRLFSKIKSNIHYKTSKKTALRFAIAFEMNVPQTTEFLRRAGFIFPDHLDPIDDIVYHQIANGNNDVLQIQKELVKHDLSIINKKTIEKNEEK